MRKYVLAALMLGTVLTSGCFRERHNRQMTVVRDCTGVYLREQHKDYRVCNYEQLDSYPEGTMVQASFKFIGSCPKLDTMIVCEMLHQNEGLIELRSVK